MPIEMENFVCEINFVNEFSARQKFKYIFYFFPTFFVIQIDKLNITHFQSTQMLCFHSIFVSSLCAKPDELFSGLFLEEEKKRQLRQVSLLKCQMYCSCVFFPALNFFATLSLAPAHRTHFVRLKWKRFQLRRTRIRTRFCGVWCR